MSFKDSKLIIFLLLLQDTLHYFFELVSFYVQHEYYSFYYFIFIIDIVSKE